MQNGYRVKSGATELHSMGDGIIPPLNPPRVGVGLGLKIPNFHNICNGGKMGQQICVELDLGFAGTRRSRMPANGEMNGKMVKKSHIKERGDRKLTHVRKGKKGLISNHSTIQTFKNLVRSPSKVGLGVLDYIGLAMVSIRIKNTQLVAHVKSGFSLLNCP